MISRRALIRQAAGLAIAAKWTPTTYADAVDATAAARTSVELAHRELWRRFVDRHGVLLDFTELDGSVDLPTAAECREHKPNALGWWTPTENGAMFNGLYLDAAVLRAKATGDGNDRANAARLADALLRLASCSDVKGFVGRGFADDGKTTWAMGSNDQTGPWFYGLWRYVDSGLADEASRRRIVQTMQEVAGALVASDWRMPSQPPFGFRGSFKGFQWNGAPRLLFVCQAMHQLSGDKAWETRYRAALEEAARPNMPTRLAICERGMVFEKKGEAKPGRATWTASPTVACLRGLWEMEQEPQVRGAYARGLSASAAMAVEGLAYRKDFSNDDQAHWEPDWRKINVHWKPQTTIDDAETVARAQLAEINKLSPRRRQELKEVREAAFAAWVITLCPERQVVQQHEPEILRTLGHFRADRLRFVSFFPIENAWWRLQDGA